MSDERFTTLPLRNHTLEIDRESGSLRISASGQQMFFSREEVHQTLPFLIENAHVFEDPDELDRREERDFQIAAREERKTEEWLENGRRSDNQVAYDELHEDAARIAKQSEHMMAESEAHELHSIISKDAPWLKASVQPAHFFDDYIHPGLGWYVVHIETDTFSAEFYHFDEWIKLVEQLQASGENGEPNAISRKALDAWAAREQSRVRFIGSIPAELRERANQMLEESGERPNFSRFVLDSPALPNPGSYSYIELQPHGARNYLLELSLPPWHSGVCSVAAAEIIFNVTGVRVPVVDKPITMQPNDQALVITANKQIGLLIRKK